MTKTKNNFVKLLLALCIVAALALVALGGGLAFGTSAKAETDTPHLFLKEGAYNQGNNSNDPHTGRVLPQGYTYAIDADSDGCTYVIEIHANVCHYMFQKGGNSTYGNAQWFNVPLYYGVENGESTLIKAGSSELSTITMSHVAGNAKGDFITGHDCSVGDGIAFTFGGNYQKHADYESVITINGGDMGNVKAHVKCVTEFSDAVCEELEFASVTTPTGSNHMVLFNIAGDTGFDFSSEATNKIASIHAADNITRNHIQIGKNAVGGASAIPASSIPDYNTAAGTNINVNINENSIEFIRYNNAEPAQETAWQEGEYIVLKQGMQLANFYGGEGAPLTAASGKTYKVLQDVKYIYTGTSWVASNGVTSVTLNETEKEVDEGEDFTLTATVNGGGEHDTTVTWSSSDQDVATVDNTGKVTAVAAGTATITATSNGDSTKTATCAVTVNEIFTPLTFVNPTFGANPAGGANLHQVVINFANDMTIDHTIEGLQGIGQLDNNFPDFGPKFLYNGKSILAYNSQNDMNVNWHIRDKFIEVLRYNKQNQEVAFQEGDTIEITEGFMIFGLVPNAGWANSDGHRVRTPQTQKFILKSGQWVAPDGVANVTLSETEKSLEKGGDFTLTATVNGGGEHATTVTWSSSDESVATVDANGKVTAVAAGTATITATSTADNTKTATCAVTVTAPTEPGDNTGDNPGGNTGDNTGDNNQNGGNTGNENEKGKKGCGGSVAASAAGAAVVLVLAAGAVLVSKKRRQA